jgi:hypothetical protein
MILEDGVLYPAADHLVIPPTSSDGRSHRRGYLRYIIELGSREHSRARAIWAIAVVEDGKYAVCGEFEPTVAFRCHLA